MNVLRCRCVNVFSSSKLRLVLYKMTRIFQQAKIGQLQSLVMQQIQGRIHREHDKHNARETAVVEQNNLHDISPEMTSDSKDPRVHSSLDRQRTDARNEPETASESSATSLGLEAVDLEDLEELAAKDGTTQQILQIFNQLNVSGEGVHAGWFSPAARKHQFKPCRRCQDTILDL